MTADDTAPAAGGGLAVDLFLVGAHGPAQTVAYAQAAERAGFDGVWLAEHHFVSYGHTPSATVLAGNVLGATQHIAVGTAACVLSARHPVGLGEEAALLDAVAPGRFRLGVARGGPWAELDVFGTGLARYRSGFGEGLDLLRQWLSGAPRVGAAGEWYQFPDVAVVPQPARPVPLWVAATSAPTVALAAARGLPLLLGVHEDEHSRQEYIDRYDREARAAGHDPAAVPHAAVCLAYLGHPDALVTPLRQWLATTAEYVRAAGADGPASPRNVPTRPQDTAPPRDTDAYADRLVRTHPVAPAPSGVAQLARVAGRLRTAGVRHLLLMVEAPGPGQTAAQIDALGRALPEVRRAAAEAEEGSLLGNSA